MNNWQTLADAVLEEDRLLRDRLARCPQSLRERGGPEGQLSFKETLGHIGFWDQFTVEFFSHRLDKTSLDLQAPRNFEERSAEALAAIDKLPFGEVLARYLESTGALLSFVRNHWSELSIREKHDFWIPLKHRKQHRLALFQLLDELVGEGSELDPDHFKLSAEA